MLSAASPRLVKSSNALALLHRNRADTRSGTSASAVPTGGPHLAEGRSTLMDDLLARFWPDLVGRVSGPLTLRLILQPLVAIAFAIRAGVADARAGRPLYSWTVLTSPAHHVDMLREGWRTVAKVFVMATIIDVVYQVMDFGWVYPIQALVVAFLLACVPYLLIRGPANRIATAWHHGRKPREARLP